MQRIVRIGEHRLRAGWQPMGDAMLWGMAFIIDIMEPAV
jgi:hypothetical protein